MSDLISRSALIEAIKQRMKLHEKDAEDKAWEFHCNSQELFLRLADECQAIIEMIEEQPPVEPVRGKWIFTPTFNEYECSNCKGMISLSDDANAHPNFCPNCGCDMRGEKND